MRLLHTSFFTETPIGVINQIHSESVAAEKIGVDLISKVISVGNGTALTSANQIALTHRSRTLRWIEARRKYARWIIEQQNEFDAMLVRWNMADPIFAHAISKIKCPVFTVHHTHEPAELGISAKLGVIRRHIDNYSFGLVSRNISGVVAVTEEILRFEQDRAKNRVPGFVYPNGIHYERNVFPCGKIGDQPVPEIVFVASYFSQWQGLDRLLASIRRSSRRFRINIVGKVDENTLSSETDPRVVFHGVLGKDEVGAIYTRCDVGLTAFALERKKVRQACTLKCREYLKNGLLVYSGHQDVFPEEFSFYKRDRPDIDRIVEFVNINRGIDKSIISEAARPYIDKEVLLQNLYDWVVETAPGK